MEYTRHILRTLLALAGALLLVACATVEEEFADEPFTEAGLLEDDIAGSLERGDLAHTINLVGYGLERDLLSTARVAPIARQLAADLHTHLVRARLNRDFATAISAIRNARLLEEFAASLGIPVEPLPPRYSVDGELSAWTRSNLIADRPVLALATLMRRSSLSDMEDEEVLSFIDLARRFNNDEALERLMRVAQQRGVQVPQPPDPLRGPGDSPARMLEGTVTVWVNRGIAIREGVGFPDREIGSGFFVDPRGYLLTNYHVIESEVDPTYEGFSRLYIKLPGRPDERVPARVIGYDRLFDIALLKVEIDPAYVFSLSSVRTVDPGERVLVLGSPAGLESTVTSGIVSASGRRFLQLGQALQIDAPVNPGNSGGPMVLVDGQVAGVVFAGLEPFEGLNFAIPTYWITRFFPRLFEEGEVVHPWIGAAVRETGDGLEVVYVAPDSPAYHAGVSAGDALLELSGSRVTEIADVHAHLLGLDSDAWIDGTWRVDGRSQRRLIALGERPFSPVERALERQPIDQLFPVLFGMDVHEIASAPWGPDYVITDVFPGSIADESSLSIDDPFALRGWRVDDEIRAAFIEIVIKRRKAGFLESGVQLGAFLETSSFI